MSSVLGIAAGASAAALVLGLWLGAEWQQGREALELKDLQEAARIAAKKADEDGVEHANTRDKLAALQADKRRKVYGLTTGRECLSAGAVRLLNGAPADVPAAAGEPASAAGAFATDRDVGDALAICRGEHAKLSDQLNKILDIEDRRIGDR
jgi:hypothetical protein